MRLRLFFLAALLCAGCGKSDVVPVSGIVTLDGQPLAHATVVFEPDSDAKEPGPGSTGVTDENGKYTLQIMTTNASGARVGKHKVKITAYEGDGEAPSSDPNQAKNVFRKPRLPPEYNSQSTLTFEVPAKGSTTADFKLTSTLAKPQ